MDPIQRAVANPPRKIVMQRAARRKIFWNIPPLAAGAQDVHHAVHDGPHFGPPLTAPTFGGRNQRLDTCPFVISQVARISQVIAVVLRPVLVRPQCKPLLESGWAPSNPSDSKESRSLRTDTERPRSRVNLRRRSMASSYARGAQGARRPVPAGNVFLHR